VSEARNAGKYALCWDRTDGNVATFYNYKGVLCEFFKEDLKVASGKQDTAAALDELRK